MARRPADRPGARSATSGSWRTSTRARPPPPSGSCSTPGSTTRSVRSTTAPPRWTGWSRSRSAASRSRRPPRPASGTTTRSTSSTPRPRRLHRRGGALAARARRCRRGVRRRAGVEPQSETVWRQADQVRRPAHLLRQQDRPLGAEFYFTVRTIEDRLGAMPLPIQLPIGAEGDFIGVVDLVEMKALVWRGEVAKGEDYTIEEIPADMADEAAEYRREAARDRRRDRRRPDGDLPRGRGARPTEQLKAAIRRIANDRRRLPGALRLGVQEQGRAAHARRGRRLPALAAGHRGRRGPRAGRRDPGHAAQAQTGRAVLGAGVQDH